ncbi:MAG: 23S rRNA (adenine(2503)-C(2))-methyltransferase RlmN [Lachnospiraceae bacterium]|nr:23S rRNA (adenine(2503)-C(2))-methyltransferase RlmN [Lachnospiraceae bacterium]
MMDTRPDIKSLTLDQLKEEMVKMGEKPFRSGQIYEWLHGKWARDFDEMSNLSKSLREMLKERFRLVTLKEVKMQQSRADGTRKYLFALPDGNVVESVWMQYHYGNSVCISSQAGCRMGCRFCASTLDGLARNLAPSEMLDQIYAISRQTGQRVSHVVVMGTGEPLDNYENLLQFLSLLMSEKGMNMGQRNITVSTCGLVPQMYRLADEKLQITLALSLHGSTDEKRKKLMPIAEVHSLQEVLAACDYYVKKTGRRITFEYSLIRDINDTQEDARQLCAIARNLNCHINLIPVNPVKERSFASPQRAGVDMFKEILEINGVNVTVRRGLGRDIDGSCGQLRRRYVTGAVTEI